MKLLSIDPGKCKCGLVLADQVKRKVLQALVIESELLVNHVIDFQKDYSELNVIIGNGTTSELFIKQLDFLDLEVSVVDEKNSTLRAKERYFDIYPTSGIKKFLFREIIISNLNLDAMSALVILEDFSGFRYDFSSTIDTKTWRK